MNQPMFSVVDVIESGATRYQITKRDPSSGKRVPLPTRYWSSITAEVQCADLNAEHCQGCGHRLDLIERRHIDSDRCVLCAADGTEVRL